MRRKWKNESGLSLVEMLAAVAVLIMLVLLLTTGMNMALSTYRSIIAQSEVELLLSTAVDAVADELRYARDVREESGGFTYTSDTYGEGTQLVLDEDTGQIMANSALEFRLLSTGVYGRDASYKSYKICKVDAEEGALQPSIIHLNDLGGDPSEITFTIRMKVVDEDTGISASTPVGGVTVRCLNPGAS